GGEDVPHPGRQGEHRQTDRGPHAAPPLRAPARGRPIRVRLRSGAKSMRIQCPNCPAAYELDDGRVPPSGLSIKCPKCKTPFTVHRPKPGEGKAAGQKVPLHGTGAPPARPAGAKPPAKGVVPLPGTQASAAAPKKPPGAV